LAKASHLIAMVLSQKERQSFTKDLVHLRPVLPRCVMTRDGSKCYNVRHPAALFEAITAGFSLRRRFLEHSDALTAPEDLGLWLEGHGDLVLPDCCELGTYVGHAALSVNNDPQIKV